MQVLRRNPESLLLSGVVRCTVLHGRQAKQLKSDTAAYIAGLIDGEGTVTLSRLHANENRRLVVSIASTEIQLLSFVIDQFGAGKITRKKASSARHAPSFCYSVTSRHALDLLRQTSPYLRSYKKIRADLALDQYQLLTPRNGKYTKDLVARRMKFESQFLSITSGLRRFT